MTSKLVLLAFLLFGSVWTTTPFEQSIFPCLGDAAFLIDLSTGATTYQQFVVPFLNNLTDYFSTSQDGSHEALIRFCDLDTTEIAIGFSYNQNPLVLKERIGWTPAGHCSNESRSLELALNLTYTNLFGPSDYARPLGSSARIVVIVTTGPATDASSPDLPIIDQLTADEAVSIFAIGIGPEITADYLRMLTRGNASRTFMIDDFTQLADILGDLTWTLGDTCSSPPWAKICMSEIAPGTSRVSGRKMESISKKLAMSEGNLTAVLLGLSQAAVGANTQKADGIASYLLTLLINPIANMSEYEIYLTAMTLFELSRAYPLTDETFAYSIRVMDIMLDQDQVIIRRSNFVYGTSQYIQKFFYQLSSHTTAPFLVHDSPNLFIVIQEIRCDHLYPSADVMGIVQITSDTVCASDQSILVNNQTLDSEWDVYVELPIDAVCRRVQEMNESNLDQAIYRATSILYRTVKLFGGENPTLDASGTSSKNKCDTRIIPQSEYAVAIYVVRSNNVSQGEDAQFVPIRLDDDEKLSFGMAIRGSNSSTNPIVERCASWDGENWASGGCSLVQLAEGVKSCQCDHAATFTIVREYQDGPACSSPPWYKYCTSEIAARPSPFAPPESVISPIPNDQNLTASLIELSQDAINATTQTAQDVSWNLVGLLINSVQNLTEYEIYLTALTLYEISLAYPLTDLTFSNSIQVVDIILDQDQRTIRRSNSIYGTTEYLQKFFYQLSAHTLPDFLTLNTQHVFVAIQSVQCDAYSSSDVVGLIQINPDTVCVPDRNVQYDKKSDQDWQAYMELPVSAICTAEAPQSKDSGLHVHLAAGLTSQSDSPRYRAASILYRNSKLFGQEDTNNTSSNTPSACVVQTYPQSQYITTMDLTRTNDVTSGEVPIVHWRLGGAINFGMAAWNNSETDLLHAADRCAYWDGDHWASEGCSPNVKVVGDMKSCQCKHLTDFTLIVDYQKHDPILCDTSLSNFGLAMAIISMIALFIALVLYTLKTHHGRLPDSLQKIRLIQILKDLKAGESAAQKKNVAQWLMVSLFVFLLAFVLLSNQNVCDLSDYGCEIAGASLYCLILCTFLWVPFITINFSSKFIHQGRMMGIYDCLLSEKLTFPTALGVPVFVTLCVWFANESFYARKDGLCWIRPIEVYVVPGVILPLALFVIPDLVLSVLIVKAVVCSPAAKSQQNPAVRRSSLISLVFVIVNVQALLGLPWILQYFTIGLNTSIAVHYAYTFFNGGQGVWIASIYIILWIRAVVTQSKKPPKQQRTPAAVAAEEGEDRRNERS